MKIGPYQITELLKKSPSAIIYRAHLDDPNETYIIKAYRLRKAASSGARAQIKREYEILRDLELEGIIDCRDLVTETGHVALVLEDFSAESLESLLRELPDKRLTLESFVSLAQRLASILGDLHEKRVLHLDIKPDNILVADGLETVKLGDFGVSRVLSDNSIAIAGDGFVGGSLPYISPEQSGRVNRSVDHRSDIYSLGITLYQCLTGRRPFAYSDPLEMIHAHVAEAPLLPSARVAGIPETLSQIVLKCIAKSPEQRYQNAHGLAADLRTCEMQIKEKGFVEPFDLGSKDLSPHLMIPENLYGREQESLLLIQQFEAAVSRSTFQISLVSGVSGIGKSSLIGELNKPLLAKRGYFVSGKFEPLGRDRPYSAVITALESLIDKILVEPEINVDFWRRRISDALMGNGKILTDLVPSLELIIGAQQPLPQLEPDASKTRFFQVMSDFFGVFGRDEHPLVVFLDDLQWADFGSIRLIEELVATRHQRCFHLILAFRVDEIDKSHAFHIVLDRIGVDLDSLTKTQWIGGDKNLKESAGPSQPQPRSDITAICPKPLTQNHVRQLLADCLHLPAADTEELAHWILAKSGGNPFSVRHFIAMLYQDGLLRLDVESGWNWQIDEIKDVAVAPDVVGMLIDKIYGLDPELRKTLTSAAAIGVGFDLQDLAAIIDRPIDSVAAELGEARRMGLLDWRGQAYRFVHDAIREAAYSPLDERGRQDIHHRIGKHFIDKEGATDRDFSDLSIDLFRITDHFNIARGLIHEADEVDQLIALNTLAGDRALRSSAYTPALDYLRRAADLLGPDAWSRSTARMMEIMHKAIQASYLATEYSVLESILADVEKRAASLEEMSWVHVFRLHLFLARGEQKRAIDYGIKALASIGFHVPANPGKLKSAIESLRTIISLKLASDEELLKLPDATDVKIRLVGRIISVFGLAVFYSRPNILAVMLGRILRLYLKHGYGPGANYLLAGFTGTVIVGAYGRVALGERLVEICRKLTPRAHLQRYATRIQSVDNDLLKHRQMPMRDVIQHVLETHREALALGDQEFFVNTAFILSSQALHAELTLKESRELLEPIREALGGYQHHHLMRYFRFNYQSIDTLTHDAETPWIVKGEIFDEEAEGWSAKTDHERLPMEELVYHKAKFVAAYLLGRYSEAEDCNIRILESLNKGVMRGHYSEVFLTHYNSLIHLAICRSEGIRDAERKRRMKKVRSNQKIMKLLAEAAPSNNLWKYQLVKAEIARVRKQPYRAIKLYIKAIEGARVHKFLLSEARACELLSEVFREESLDGPSDYFLRMAYVCYARWHFVAKTSALREQYPYLDLTDLSRDALGDTRISIERSQTVRGEDGLDLNSIIESARSISTDVSIDSLLEKVANIVTRVAGAEKTALLIRSKASSELNLATVVEPEKIDDVQRAERPSETSSTDNAATDYKQAKPWAESRELPHTVIRLVLRTMSPLNIAAATADERFAHDPYVRDRRVQSILCVPIVRQDELSGLIYLENNAATDVFTPGRIDLIGAIAAQAAISVENAFLYESLSERVQERTVQLEEKSRQLQVKNNDIQAMLQNLEQGVFTFADNFKVDGEYSRHLERIFEAGELSGRDVLPLLSDSSNLGSDAIDAMRACLASSFGESPLSFELNSHLLVREIRVSFDKDRTKCLAVDWAPIADHSGEIVKILVAVRDMTAIKALERDAREKRREMEILTELIASGHHGLGNFLASSVDRMESLAPRVDELASLDSGRAVEAMFQVTHNIKGVARTLGLERITDNIHDLEDILDQARNNENSAPLPQESQAAIRDRTQGLGAALREYRRIWESKLQGLGEKSGSFGPDITGLVEDLRKQRQPPTSQQLQELGQILIQECDSNSAIALSQELAAVKDQVAKLAEDEGKPAPVLSITDGEVGFVPEVGNDLMEILGHCIGNCLSHGIENEAERVDAGKTRVGTIHVRCSPTKDGATIEIFDDGRGLNLSEIAATAVRRGIIPDADGWSDEKIADLVFAPGFSTAGVTTKLAGRGVGMGAIRNTVNERGGTLEIAFSGERDERAFRAFKVVITLPQRWVAPTSSERLRLAG